MTENPLIRPMSRRRFLAAGSMTIGSMLLAACGSSGNGSSDTGSSTLTPSSDTKPGGSINILDDNTNTAFANGAISAFEKASGIKVDKYVQANFNDLHDQLATMFSAQDSSFDVVMTWAGWSAEFGQAGWLRELTQDELPADVIQPALDAVSWRGKIYGIPKFVSVQTMFWNKRMAESAGLDPDTAPEDWDQFLAAAKAMTGDGVYGYTCDMGNDAGVQQNFLRFLLMCGGTLYDDDFNPVFDSDEGVLALTTMVDLLNKDKVMNPASLQITNSSDLSALFAGGNTGIVFNWPQQYAIATGADSTLKAEDVGNAIIPGIKVRSASIDGSEGFAISKYSKNPDAALEWLRFVTTADVQKDIVKEGWFPVSETALKDPANIKALPVLETYEQTLPYESKRFGTPWSNEFDHDLAIQLHRAMNQEITPKEALDTTAEAAKKLVSKYLG